MSFEEAGQDDIGLTSWSEAGPWLAGEPGAFITVLLILVFYNGFDGIFTYHMAKKGYMAAKV